MEPVPAHDEIRITATNWLDEVSVEEGTMEWTAAEGGGVRDRERLTRRAFATSSRCPRTRTGRFASSTTTITATPADRRISASSVACVQSTLRSLRP